MNASECVWVVGATVALGVLSAACSQGPSEAGASPPAPTAKVQVASLLRRKLTERLDLYGSIGSGPAGHQALSVPYESRVAQILVRAGQRIDAGAALIKVEPSPDTALAVQQARAAVKSAHETFDAVRGQFRLQLATNQQFEQAERAAKVADLQLASLARRGSTRSRELITPGPAVVASVRVSEGAIVSAGAPLIELDLRQHREAVLGAEVEDLHRIEPGMDIVVSDLVLPPVVTSHGVVRAVADVVDLETRLVDVFATLPDGAPFILGQPIVGTIDITGKPTLVVPRSALLPIEDHLVVFTIVDGHAVSHTVQIGLQSDDEVEVVSNDLTEGDQVVVSGVVALRDGMTVHVEASP